MSHQWKTKPPATGNTSESLATLGRRGRMGDAGTGTVVVSTLTRLAAQNHSARTTSPNWRTGAPQGPLLTRRPGSQGSMLSGHSPLTPPRNQGRRLSATAGQFPQGQSEPLLHRPHWPYFPALLRSATGAPSFPGEPSPTPTTADLTRHCLSASDPSTDSFHWRVIDYPHSSVIHRKGGPSASPSTGLPDSQSLRHAAGTQ